MSWNSRVCDTLTEWYSKETMIHKRKKKYQGKTDIKIKRAQKTRADWNQGFKQAKKQKKDGTDYVWNGYK
jgi:hypothetical protein